MLYIFIFSKSWICIKFIWSNWLPCFYRCDDSSCCDLDFYKSSSRNNSKFRSRKVVFFLSHVDIYSIKLHYTYYCIKNNFCVLKKVSVWFSPVRYQPFWKWGLSGRLQRPHQISHIDSPIRQISSRICSSVGYALPWYAGLNATSNARHSICLEFIVRVTIAPGLLLPWSKSAFCLSSDLCHSVTNKWYHCFFVSSKNCSARSFVAGVRDARSLFGTVRSRSTLASSVVTLETLSLQIRVISSERSTNV